MYSWFAVAFCDIHFGFFATFSRNNGRYSHGCCYPTAKSRIQIRMRNASDCVIEFHFIISLAVSGSGFAEKKTLNKSYSLPFFSHASFFCSNKDSLVPKPILLFLSSVSQEQNIIQQQHQKQQLKARKGLHKCAIFVVQRTLNQDQSI